MNFHTISERSGTPNANTDIQEVDTAIKNHLRPDLDTIVKYKYYEWYTERERLAVMLTKPAGEDQELKYTQEKERMMKRREQTQKAINRMAEHVNAMRNQRMDVFLAAGKKIRDKADELEILNRAERPMASHLTGMTLWDMVVRALLDVTTKHNEQFDLNTNESEALYQNGQFNWQHEVGLA